jgi:PAS domain S-box-containing protein
MGLAAFSNGVWWQFLLAGTVLLNVIEGGKSKRSSVPRRHIEVGSLLDALPQAVFLLDQRGRITNLNQPAERMMARVRGDLLGLEVESLLGNRLDKDAIASLVPQALRGNASRTGQIVFQRSGDSLLVVVCANPIRDQQGSVSDVLLIIQDVTEQTALREHSDSNERHVAVGQMTAGLVHDFNNVLSTIGEAVTVLEADKHRSNQDLTVLGIIGNAVHYGAEIIRNTRRYLIGGHEKPSRIDVRLLLEEVLELTHPMLQTYPGIRIVRETQDCAEVMASPDELRRALTNLVLNALDAMPEGGTLTVSCKRDSHNVVIALADTGIGIPLEAQRKIFSPYFTTKAKGTGLGLAGARRAIHTQGGEIRFESAPGVGTTFYVTLPLGAGHERRNPSAA